MKLPSLNQLAEAALKAFRRFPLVILDAGLGTVAALVLADREGEPTASVLFPVLLAASLGVPFLTALALIAEKRRFRISTSAALQCGGVLVLILYSLIVPQDLPHSPAAHMIRFLLLAVAAVLFVSVGPFLNSGQLNGFWHFNKSMFLRVLTSVLYSVVLYAGLAIALAALDNLFGVDVPGRRYFELWILIVGLFNTWFFLAGIPEDLDSLDSLAEYPKGLKVFAQYILFPLLGVYVVILYAYIGKIVFSWAWPHGWVSKLILGFAGTGIFSVLLVYPIAEKVDNAWMRAFSRRFNLVLIPMIPLLLLALWRRISEYGWTEGRYLAVILSFWLIAYVGYFMLSNAKNIKLIPLSLCLLALLVGFGRWGAFGVSESSQVSQLEQLLIRDSILVNGAITDRHDSLSTESTKRISSMLTYLHDFHGWGSISSWFESGGRELPMAESPAAVAKRMGVRYVRIWQIESGGTIVFTADNDGTADISGLDHALRLRRFTSGDKTYSNDELRYSLDPRGESIMFYHRRGGAESDSVEINVRQLAEKLIAEYGHVSTENIPVESMSLSAEGLTLRVKICLSTLRIQREDDLVKSIGYSGDVYYAIKAGP